MWEVETNFKDCCCCNPDLPEEDGNGIAYTHTHKRQKRMLVPIGKKNTKKC